MKGESNRSAQLQNVITMMTVTFVADVFSILKIVLLEEKRSKCSFIPDDKAKGGYTTRHGSYLTKTSDGVAESEDAEGKKPKT